MFRGASVGSVSCCGSFGSLAPCQVSGALGPQAYGGQAGVAQILAWKGLAFSPETTKAPPRA